MTPEERWTRIENLLATTMEHQVAAQVQIEKNATHIKEVATQTEKNTAAIRDLIKISGALIESQKATDEKLSGLINAVGRLEISVERLGGTVDRMATKIDKIGDMWERFLKSRGGPNGNV